MKANEFNLMMIYQVFKIALNKSNVSNADAKEMGNVKLVRNRFDVCSSAQNDSGIIGYDLRFGGKRLALPMTGQWKLNKFIVYTNARAVCCIVSC